ncbi:hypothetical protein [Paracoccus sp. (in: a-proteobacteria)]|uniref:hypothetical protein n=1 Tax=Paracoccus sp. TaxID=267 RepID=UPI003A843FDF
MPAPRDPFTNPFPSTDPDRRDIWDMLVRRDIDAYVRADWQAVADDFIATGFTGIDARFQPDPDGFALSFPTLPAYRDRWLKKAREFRTEQAAGAFSGDPRRAIYHATRLERIEIDGDAALARKKFDGGLHRTNGGFDRMNWQTLYICRRKANRWKIAGFVGYLPHVKD